MAENNNLANIGLLILRVGIGAMFILHGYPKLTAGTDLWIKLGSSMNYLGVHFAPAFWGFMAAFAEFAGGVCLILGIAFRISAALMAFTMYVAVLKHFGTGNTLLQTSHAIEMLIVFSALLFTGPGRYSLASITKLKILN